MDVQNFKDRFSLDYLSPAPAASSSAKPRETQVTSDVDAVVKSYGNLILNMMKTLPNQSSDLLGLAKLGSTRFETLLPVVQHLSDEGLLERVVNDPSGNDTYKVTYAGQNLDLSRR
jgi:hypothetical protein